MTLLPGCPLVVPPAFHLPIDWSQRLLLGAGVERERGGFVPRPDWRVPTSHELDLLTPALMDASSLRNSLCLFRLPQHLCSAWLRLLERADNTGHLEGFAGFVARVADFLAFKDLPVPASAAFDLLVSSPGLRSIHRSGAPFGLAFQLGADAPIPGEDALRWPRLWGGINLGSESTSLVFVNLFASDLLAELHRRHAEATPPGTLGELADEFLKWCPDYPPVRLRMEPGEGFRLPEAGLLVDVSTLDRTEPDVLLLVRQQVP